MSTSGTANSVSLSSKTRWAIVALLSASMAINLLDRQIINVLAPILRESYKWSATQYAYIAVAFQIGMMIGQVPAGSFMDRVGTRIGLATIFAAWSIVGGAQAFVASLSGFIVLRFLMGLTECGNYTAGIKAIAGLFPGASRSTAGGVFNAGAQLGSVIAPLFVLALLRERLGFSVSLAFIFTTALGLIWLIPWLAIFPDKETMAAVSVKPAGPRPPPLRRRSPWDSSFATVRSWGSS